MKRESTREMVFNMRVKVGALDTKLDNHIALSNERSTNHLKHHEKKDRLWTLLFVGIFIAIAGVIFDKAIDKVIDKLF